MKAIVIIFALVHALSISAFAESSSHQCKVLASVQVFDAKTLARKRVTSGESSWFAVTREAHEYERAMKIMSGSVQLGEGKIWTGTLLGTEEGDLLQANASFTIEELPGDATLMMDLKSPMAKTIVNLTKESPREIYLISTTLKCVAE